VPRPRLVRQRSPQLAWFIAAPLAAFTAAVTLTLARGDPFPTNRLAAALIIFAISVGTEATTLLLSARQQTYAVSLSEISLLLAVVYLPPALVVVTRLSALLAVQLWRRVSLIKIGFNLASIGAATSVANLVVAGWGPVSSLAPHTWPVLAAAVAGSTYTTLAATGAVISFVQGGLSVPALTRTALNGTAVMAVNITVSLIVLLVIHHEPLSIPLLLGLGAMLVLVYRSYAKFVQQHRSLTELYELTRAISEAARDNGLPDALLGRVRELLQAESATLWLPAQGRHPPVLLTARVDYHGLLDVADTPELLRQRAVSEGVTVAVGRRTGDAHLRAALRGAGIKDSIVVPLRSGSAVIGSLEVAGRLGDLNRFIPADVRLLETLGAHVSVAVENSRLVERLRFDAYHDVLTGLPNRRRLLASLEEAVKVRAPNEVVAVLVFDVDGQRDVNDSLGHDAGDRLLIEVATRLRAITPAAALVGRAGGDEFAVTLRLPGVAEALSIAAQLRAALHQPMALDSITLDVDTAVGVAVHPDHGEEAEELLRRADVAALAAKQLDVPVQLFLPSLESRSTHRLELAGDLRRAVDDGDIEVYFQPMVALAGRRVIGVECLVRWEHSAHGPVSPPEFIAVAEHTGQLSRLTDLVLREGLRRCQGWAEAGHPLRVAVNLAPRLLADPAFPSRVDQFLREYGVAPALLTLEITEGGVMGDVHRPLPALRALHDMGVRLAVDNFGTGHSSLAHLRRLPVHEVKIDRSFVQGMATDDGDLAIVRAVVGLARHFGLTVVAEGVESELTVSLLEELGCDVGQGFLFSRPLPFERFEAWLAVQTESEPIPGGQLIGEITPGIRRLRAVQ
jgi:diguanylate cyclase (GGDEF)-like protein